VFYLHMPVYLVIHDSGKVSLERLLLSQTVSRPVAIVPVKCFLLYGCTTVHLTDQLNVQL
jgi:hypothetical protein